MTIRSGLSTGEAGREVICYFLECHILEKATYSHQISGISRWGKISTFVVVLKFRVGAFERQSLLRIEEQKEMKTTTAIGETKLVWVGAAASGLLII